MRIYTLAAILIFAFALATASQDYGKSEIISWISLADYFPNMLNGKMADEEIKGANNHAGPASVSEASRTYGNGCYILSMKYAAENCTTKETYFTMKSQGAVDNRAFRDNAFQRFSVNGFTAYGEYDQFAKTATVTVYLDNCVSICVKTSNAKGLGDSTVVFKAIKIDKINELQP